MTKTQSENKKPAILLTLEQKKELVAKVETLREQGLAVLQATKKVGVHMPTYYGYKKQIEKNTKKPKRKYTRKTDTKTATALVPVNKTARMLPHTIEYIERPSPKNGTLMMVIGSPETVFEFVKKMRGE
jgi:hypothetical protein